jgi:hypothetical protein
MKSPYRPAPSEFQSLIAAIQALDKKRIEESIERIAKGALAAKRKPSTKCRIPARKTYSK